MKTETKFVPENIKQIITAIAPLFVVIILFLVVGKFGVAKVLDIRLQVKSAQKNEEVLTQKLSLLQTLSPGANQMASVVSSALPEANPSLAVMSQLKLLATSQAVILSNLKSTSGSSGKSDMKETNTSFTLLGGKGQVFEFLKRTTNIAPLITVKNISISDAGGGISADVTVASYWADLPKTIPAIDEPIMDLTASEKQILTNVSSLSQPVFMDIAPSQADINPLPFGQ
jgi:hypothetical protein